MARGWSRGAGIRRPALQGAGLPALGATLGAHPRGSCRARRLSTRTAEELEDLGVGRLGEVLVPEPHRHQVAGRQHAHDLVRRRDQPRRGVRAAHGDGEHESAGLALAQRQEGGLGGHPGGEPVVHEDDVAPAHGRERASAAVARHPPVQLAARAVGEALELRRRQPQRADQVAADDRSALGDGADAELLMARRTDLPGHEHLERGAEASRHLLRDRYAAAREREHERIDEVGRQVLRQLPSRVDPVAEARLHPASVPLSGHGRDSGQATSGSSTGSRSRRRATSQSAGCSL